MSGFHHSSINLFLFFQMVNVADGTWYSSLLPPFCAELSLLKIKHVTFIIDNIRENIIIILTIAILLLQIFILHILICYRNVRNRLQMHRRSNYLQWNSDNVTSVFPPCLQVLHIMYVKHLGHVGSGSYFRAVSYTSINVVVACCIIVVAAIII